MASDSLSSIHFDPTPPRLPIPSSQTSPILLANGCADICPAFIAAIRSSFPSCPITAFFPSETPIRSSDEAELIAMGVALHRRQSHYFPYQEKCSLVRSHPRVLIFASFRYRVLRGHGQYGSYLEPESARHHRDEVMEWIGACNDHKAAHVIYVSTAFT